MFEIFESRCTKKHEDILANQSNTRADNGFLKEAFHAFIYSAVQSPTNALVELYDHVHGTDHLKDVQVIEPIEQAQFFSSSWFGQQIGGALGLAADFMLLARLPGPLGRLFGACNQNSAPAKIKQSLIAGTLYGGLLRPSDTNQDFLSSRLHHAIIDGLTFGVLTAAGGHARESLERPISAWQKFLSFAGERLPSGGYIESQYAKQTATTFVSGVISGFPAGVVNAETNSLMSKHKLASSRELCESILGFSVIGGTIGLGHDCLSRAITKTKPLQQYESNIALCSHAAAEEKSTLQGDTGEKAADNLASLNKRKIHSNTEFDTFKVRFERDYQQEHNGESPPIKTILEAAKEKYISFDYIDLSYADLRGAKLSRAWLRYANLSHADLRGADLSGAHLFETQLTNANLEGVNLEYADITKANLKHANLRGAQLNGVSARHATFGYANLHNANLAEADLVDATLDNTDLSTASYVDGMKIDAHSARQARLADDTIVIPTLLSPEYASQDLRTLGISQQGLGKQYVQSANGVVRIYESQKLIDSDISEQTATVGSGFFVHHEGKLKIATAYHVVVDNPDSLCVVTRDGKRYSATVEKVSPANDLALLTAKISADQVQPLPLANGSQHVKQNSNIYAFGHPRGWSETYLSPGKVLNNLDSFDSFRIESQPNENVKRNVIASDMTVLGGNSGGPLLDETGNVVGVIVRADGRHISYASLVEHLHELLNSTTGTH